MTVHFAREEFDLRLARTLAAMEAAGLDALLCFKQESMYWLTGYDTFGYCFFQCLVVRADGRMALLTRAPDLRQAQLTSILADVRVWVDRDGAVPADDLKTLLNELGLAGKRLGVEWQTHGLTAANGRMLDAALEGFAVAGGRVAAGVAPAAGQVAGRARLRAPGGRARRRRPGRGHRPHGRGCGRGRDPGADA